MQIAHIFWSFKFGGIETLLVNLANIQSESGHTVSIIIINDYVDQELVSALNKNVRFYCLKRKLHSKIPYFISRLNSVISDIKPDIIHLHNSCFYPLLTRSMQKRCCCTLHALPYGKTHLHTLIPRVIYSLPGIVSGNVNFIDRIPAVFSISHAVKKELLEHYHINSKVIYNGIPTDTFNKVKNRNEDGIFRMVSIGRLDHTDKGQDLLLKAIHHLRNCGLEKIRLEIIGEGYSRRFLENLIKEYDLEKYVSLLGKKNQTFIKQNLCHYDLFIQPSRKDGFGLTVAEGMCAQVPVLVSSGQGPEEITEGEVYGWVFENGNSMHLAEQIRYIITHQKERLSKVQKAYQHVMNEFDIHHVCRKYIREYQMLLSEQNK